MTLKRRLDNRGLALAELLISLGLGVVFLASVINTWIATTQMWNQESIRSRLRFQVEKAVERMKYDIRLSDGGGLVFYPEDASTHTAISIPRATPDANGFLDLSPGSIGWDTTIIYHVRTNNGMMELCRTELDSFNPSISERQEELNNLVAEDGEGETSARVLCFAPTVSLEITPEAATFDGFAASTGRSANTSFGSARLEAGNHTIRFEIVGKNEDSTGYRMGIDTLALTPSGGLQEAEALTVAASSGDAAQAEDMSAYTGTLWGGNYQKEYRSNAVGDQITFQTYYDQWLESNFADMTYSRTEITGTDPVLTIMSREDQSLVPAWDVEQQIPTGAPADAVLPNQNMRSVLDGAYFTKSGNMVRVKFEAAAGAALTLQNAWFGRRNGTIALGNGTSDFAEAPYQLFFDNAPVPAGTPDPMGAMNPGANTGVTIPAGHHVWSNWFEYPLALTAPMSDYLVSYYLNVAGGAHSWTDNPLPAPPPVYTYIVGNAVGDQSGTPVWSLFVPAAAPSPTAYATVEVAAWRNSGAATSQVYDTGMTSPQYAGLAWDGTVPTGATVTLKARSSSNPSMSGAADWDTVSGHTSSPASIASLPSARYVQFQASLQAVSPYASLPEIDNVRIDWPGQTTLVEISGYYTKKPDYGRFKVLVDGEDTVNALEFKVSAADTFRGKSYDFSLTAEGEPRNTGK